MEKKAFILFAHGSRDPEWSTTFERIYRAIGAASPETRAELAYLEFTKPSLQEATARLVGDGYARIVVVPVFLARGGHLKQDLPLLMDELRQSHPQATFELAGAIGEEESVIQAIAAHVLTLK